MKLLKIVLILAGIHFITNVNAMDSKIILEDDLKTTKYTTKSVDFTLEHIPDSMDVVATTTKHTARSVKTEDEIEVESLFKLCNQEGLPLTASGWCKRMVDRRNTKNYFNGFVAYSKDDKSKAIGAIGFGIMPAFGYKTPIHDDIIKTWIDFGIIKQKIPGDDYAESNLERIDNRGIAVLLPIIPIEELSFENKKNIIQLGVDIVRFFKSEGCLLPIENTAPHCLITTLSPTDSLIPVYESIGFELLNKPGYKEFSPGKKRIVLYKSL